MAKHKTIDEAVEELFKDYKKALKVAAKEATEKAKEDLYKNAVSCLVLYYNDYIPSSYERTHQLINSFVKYSNPIKETKDGFECIAGVIFDANKIDDAYDGSELYTPTDGQWIIDNFLAGIHPKTNGSRVVGGGNYENEKYYGDFVPSYEMQKYLDSYRYIFYNHLDFSLSKQVLKLTK